MQTVTCQCGEVYDARIRFGAWLELCGVCGSHLPVTAKLKTPRIHPPICIDLAPFEDPYRKPIDAAIAILFIGVLAIGLRAFTQ